MHNLSVGYTQTLLVSFTLCKLFNKFFCISYLIKKCTPKYLLICTGLFSVYVILNLYFSLTSGQLTNIDSTNVPPKHPVCIYMREEVIVTKTNLIVNFSRSKGLQMYKREDQELILRTPSSL